jgi:hypothetical protein
MRRKFLNRDYKIFRQETNGFSESKKVTEFMAKCFDKFIDLEREEIFDRFGFNLHDACRLILERDYDVLFVTASDKKHIVIGNDEKEFLKFFKENAPLEHYKELKRLNHLRTYGEYRDEMREEFEPYISVHYSGEYAEKMRKKKKRKEGLESLLSTSNQD